MVALPPTYKEYISDPSNLNDLLRVARANAVGVEAEEIEPGVMLAEAKVCVFHAVIVQGGFSTLESEAKRLSKDRGGKAPETPDEFRARVEASTVDPEDHDYQGDGTSRCPVCLGQMNEHISWATPS
jgi:hypothetical protein